MRLRERLTKRYRGMLVLLRYDDGTEKCVGCDLCEVACPLGGGSVGGAATV